MFIHGYNVPFPDAVRASSAADRGFGVCRAPICYSWPSQGDLAEYLQDSTNAELAAYKLKQLLLDLNAKSGPERDSPGGSQHGK